MTSFILLLYRRLQVKSNQLVHRSFATVLLNINRSSTHLLIPSLVLSLLLVLISPFCNASLVSTNLRLIQPRLLRCPLLPGSQLVLLDTLSSATDPSR